MSHRLFIFISNQLRARKYLSLADDDTDVLVIPEGLLSVGKEPAERDRSLDHMPDPWESELKSIIADKIRSYDHWKRSSVRVAGHLRTCFGTLPNMVWRKDRRFREKEAGLHEELGQQIDIQVWGFHHEPELSEIWTVVTQVGDVRKDPRDQAKAEFFAAMEEAFQRSSIAFDSTSTRENKHQTWERFSLLKHDIIGLFDPLRMRLETVRDISEKEPARANEIRTSVKGSIEPKLEQAHKLLDECKANVTGEEAAEWFRRIGGQLDAPPDLVEFADWLNQLDDCLNNLRNSVTE